MVLIRVVFDVQTLNICLLLIGSVLSEIGVLVGDFISCFENLLMYECL